MTAAVTVHADFENDVRLDLLNLLTQAGVPLTPGAQGSAHDVCKAYFNLRQRVIPRRPRQVQHSKELLARVLPDDIRAVVQLIEARAIAGESLVEHHSERAWRANTHDWLLNDWGIHHLHVRPGRGDELLYVWTERDVLRFLDVRGHDGMADTDLLEIMLANWPEALPASFDSSGENPTAQELNGARRAGVQVLVTLSNGKSYFPRGGGVTTAGGSSARAVSFADRTIDRARLLEKQFRLGAADLAEPLGVLELHLRYDLLEDRVIEQTVDHCWNISP